MQVTRYLIFHSVKRRDKKENDPYTPLNQNSLASIQFHLRDPEIDSHYK